MMMLNLRILASMSNGAFLPNLCVVSTTAEYNVENWHIYAHRMFTCASLVSFA